MSKAKALIAIDPATKTGWVYLGFNPDHVGPMYLQHGVYSLVQHRFEGAGMPHLRYRSWLKSLIETSKPDAVVFEEVVRHAGTQAAHVYGALTSIIMQVCDEQKVPYGPVAISTWKKLATGKGNAGKDLVAKCFADHMANTNNDAGKLKWPQDAIDAYFIGWAGAYQLGWVE